EDAVRIDVEGNFNLRRPPRGRRNAVEMERAEVLVVARKRALALQYFDLNPRLVVAVSREDLRLTSGNRRVTRNHRCSYAAGGFNRQSQRSNVEKQHVFDVALKHTALDRSANGYNFVRIHTFVRFLADQGACRLDDL